MEFEKAEERETGVRLTINLRLPPQLQLPSRVVPKVVKKKKKKSRKKRKKKKKAPKRKAVKRGQGIRARGKRWLKENPGKWLVSQIIEGLHAEGYRYPGTGKYGTIKIQLTTKLSEMNKKDSNISRTGPRGKYRYFYVHDESSSSGDDMIVPMDIDDIIEKNHGVKLSAEESSSEEESYDEEEEKKKSYAGKKPRYAMYATKQPRITNMVHYEQTSQLGNPLKRNGFGAVGPSTIPYQQRKAVFKPNPPKVVSDYESSSAEEEEDEVLGKRKRDFEEQPMYATKQPTYATKQPKITNMVHYEETGQLGEPFLYGGFGGLGPEAMPINQQNVGFIPDPQPLIPEYKESSDEDVYEEEPPKKRRKMNNSCNHFYERQGVHMVCRYCAHVVRDLFN